MSTPRTPLAQKRGSDKKALENGLTIGILCGVIGLFVVVVVFIVVILKFRRKKKTRDDKLQSSDSKLLTDGHTGTDVKGIYGRPLSETKSLSCPDIYAVNKSILLKLGSTALAYEQLERDSVLAAGAKYRSEDYIGVRNTSDPSINDTSSKVSRDERDGKIFDDEGHLYQTPSMLNTFGRKSGERTQTGKSSSRDLLHPNDDVYVCMHGQKSGHMNDNEECRTDYRVPSFNSPELKLNTNVRSANLSEPENNTGFVGYQSPTSNSPKVIRKSHSFNVVPLKDSSNRFSDEDNIYDVPKLEDRDEIYSNLPSEILANRGNQTNKNDDFYKMPLSLDNPRSYTVGATARKKSRDRDRVYEAPSSTSQPSLVKMTSAEKRNAMTPLDQTDGYGDEVDDDNTYDVPSQLWSADRRVNLNESDRENNSKIRDIINNMRDNNYLVDNVISSNSNINNRCTKTENHEYDPGNVGRETYDVPHNIAPSTLSHIHNDDDPYQNISPTQEGYDVPHNIASSTFSHKHNDSDLYKNISPTPEEYDVPHNIAPSTFSRINNDVDPYKNILPTHEAYDVPHNMAPYTFTHIHKDDDPYKNISPTQEGYDVPHNIAPSTFSHKHNDVDPYKNVSPTQEMPRNVKLFNKLGYDVPSTIPVFDPSQPSLLKLASKNLYKAEATDTSHDVQSSVPDFDPSLAYSRRPRNKKMNNNDNRSKHFDESLIYVDDSDQIYVTTSSRDQNVTSILPNTSLYSEREESPACDNSDDYTNGDAIYENVFKSEDGRTLLRTHVQADRP